MLIPLDNVIERVIAATGVSKSTIQRISRESKLIEQGKMSKFTTPDKKRTVNKIVSNVDDFDRCVVRRTVHNMITIHKCVPTINNLIADLRNSINFNGCKTTLRILLNKIGFKFKKN